MTTPRLALVQHLGLAVAHATRTDADWIAECRLELAHALIALAEMSGQQDPVSAAVQQCLAAKGEGN